MYVIGFVLFIVHWPHFYDSTLLVRGPSTHLLLFWSFSMHVLIPICAWSIWVSVDFPIDRHVNYILLVECGPRISAHAFPTRWRARFWFWKVILLIKKNWLGVVTYFCFIFKRVNKIRKKTLSVTPYFGKGGLWKTGSGSGVRLLIGKVW